MKGTVFAVALNHRSQLDAWQEAFSQPPYNAPPKTAVWFIKPRNTVIRHGTHSLSAGRKGTERRDSGAHCGENRQPDTP